MTTDAQNRKAWLGLLAGAACLVGWGGPLLAVEKPATMVRTSKVVILFDVSASMLQVDDVPRQGQNRQTLPTRQDKVIMFLTDGHNRFLKNIQRTNAVTCYRFGKVLDPKPRHYPPNKEWTRKELSDWLIINPERKGIDAKQEALEHSLYSGTNLGEALLRVLRAEGNNLVQAIIIVSDGRSTEANERAADKAGLLADLMRVPIICVGVGGVKPEFAIKIDDLEVPGLARADEPFAVTVPVLSRGLKGQEYQVNLEARRVKDRAGKPVKDEVYPLAAQKSRHKEVEPDRVEFTIDVAKLKGIDPKKSEEGRLEGTWEFHARVARDKREAFARPFHSSERPARVKVLDKKLRVLLFTSGPNREYQFVRALLHREVVAGRMEMGIFLQTSKEEQIDLNENKPQEWELARFPDRRVRNKAEDKPYTLYEYDLVIAFDPDWTQLTAVQMKLLREWVQEKAGGLILVAGPVYTHQLRDVKYRDDYSPICDVLPVILADGRTFGLNKSTLETLCPLKGRGMFPVAGSGEKFGFYRTYPVKKVKGIAKLHACLCVPQKGGGMVEKPFLVTARSGSGTSVFIGSLSTWRLRLHSEEYHRKFWLKLVRYAGSGYKGRLQKFGESNVPKRMTVGGKKRVEYRLSGPDGKFLPREAAARKKIQVTVILYVKGKNGAETPDTDKKNWKSYPLKAKPASRTMEAEGWFMADLAMPKPGKYLLELKIPGTPETLRNTVIVFRPDPELDNTDPDPVRLYNLASANEVVLRRSIAAAVKSKLKELVRPVAGNKTGVKDGKRLYFDLATATLIPACMVADREERIIKEKK